jgi:hypothetical protein
MLADLLSPPSLSSPYAFFFVVIAWRSVPYARNEELRRQRKKDERRCENHYVLFFASHYYYDFIMMPSTLSLSRESVTYRECSTQLYTGLY